MQIACQKRQKKVGTKKDVISKRYSTILLSDMALAIVLIANIQIVFDKV
jgi:hypothetical protein